MTRALTVVLLVILSLLILILLLTLGRRHTLSQRLAAVAVVGASLGNISLVPDPNGSGTTGLSAGVQLASIAGAIAAGAVALYAAPRAPMRPLTPTARFYLLYGVLAVAGILVAVEPRLTAFRVVSIFAAILSMRAVQVAYVETPSDSVRLPFAVAAVMALSAVVGAAINPGAALSGIDAGVGFRLEGLYPPIAANFIGELGVLFFTYGFASFNRRKWSTRILGVTLVAVTQYRTGYLSLAAVLLLYLMFRGGTARRIALVALAGVAVWFTQTPTAHSLIYRGENAQSVQTLNSRTTFWTAAIAATDRSPWYGLGLSSGTKHEVFEGTLQQTSRGSLHSTWIEAYTGTGRLGLAALALVFLAALIAAVKRSRRGDVFPLLAVAALSVRSVTGSTADVAGVLVLVLLGVANYCADSDRREAAP